MKKILITLVTLLSLNTSQAFAAENSKNFEGLQTSLGLGITNSNSKLITNSSVLKSGDTSNLLVFDLGYLKSINDKFLVGLGATYDLNKQSQAGSNSDRRDGVGFNAKTSEHYSVYLQPTYALNSATSLFAKLGFHSTKVNASDLTSNNYAAFALQKRLSGFGYGVGIMTFLNENVFVKLEAQLVNYKNSNITTASGTQYEYELKTTSSLASIGYRF